MGSVEVKKTFSSPWSCQPEPGAIWRRNDWNKQLYQKNHYQPKSITIFTLLYIMNFLTVMVSNMNSYYISQYNFNGAFPFHFSAMSAHCIFTSNRTSILLNNLSLKHVSKITSFGQKSDFQTQILVFNWEAKVTKEDSVCVAPFWRKIGTEGPGYFWYRGLWK